MSAGGGGEDEGAFELNLAPIIDCFTVLIAYLLVSASFISYTILEVGVAATGESSSSPTEPLKEPPFNLAVDLKPDRSLELKLSGGPKSISQSEIIPPAPSGQWNVEVAEGKIAAMKGNYPTLKEVNVTASDSILYRDIVKVVETIKKQIGKVFLAGSLEG